MSSLKTVDGPSMAFRAYCLDCKRFHDIRINPDVSLINEMSSWEAKHRGHRIEFQSKDRDIPKNLEDSKFEKTPWWLDFKENTNFQFAYSSAVDMTFTSLNSLASDSSLLAGASALAVDNGASSVPLEIAISGVIKNNSTAPDANDCDIYTYAALDDVPTYPDTMDGTDSAKTVTTYKILNSGFKLLKALQISATGSQINPIAPVALSTLYGVMPRYWSIWVVHNCTQALNASGHKITYKGVYVVG